MMTKRNQCCYCSLVRALKASPVVGHMSYQIIKSITDAFESRQNPQLVRHKLSMTKQEPEESIEDFVYRLKGLAAAGKVADVEATVLDALSNNCRSVELRKHILSKPDIKLTDVIRHRSMLEQFEMPAA